VRLISMIKNLSLSAKVSALCFVFILVTSASVTTIAYIQAQANVREQAQMRQAMSLAIAAQAVSTNVGTIDVAWNRDGSVRLRSENIGEFSSHELIDKIGDITGETATIFVWDPATEDFWRRTTNIKKPDGLRAVGTPLGKNGRVYPVIMAGETYNGEATILGKDYYTIYQPIKNSSGTVTGILYVGVGKEQLVDTLTTLQFRLILAGLCAACLLGGLMMLVSSVLTKALPDLSSAIESIADGDLSVGVPHRNRSDEIGTVAKALAVLKDGMQERVRLQEEQREMEAKQAELAAQQRTADLEAQQRAQQEREETDAKAKALINQTIESAACALEDNMSKVLAEINGAIEVFQRELSVLSNAAEQTDAQSQTIYKTAIDAKSNVSAMASATEELASSIREITQQIGRTSETSQKSVTTAQQTNKQVEVLKQATSDIEGFVVLIRDIAEQTNLLALNATIEAARAGAAGKGFSVVASEVKALAGQTAKATDEVSDMITRMLEAVNHAMEGLGATSEAIFSNNEIISDISESVAQQDSATSEIASAAQTAAKTSDSSAQECSKITDLAKQSKGSAGKIEDSCETLVHAADALKQQLTASISSLREVVKDAA